MFALFLTLSMMIPAASAESYIPVTATITFEGLYSIGFRNIQTNYQIRIDPLDRDAPKPSEYMITIPQRKTGQFSITIDEPGTYMYRVYQVKGDDPRIDYDDTVYLVKVFVENTDDLVTLRYAVTLTVAASDSKPSEITFQNIPSGSIPPHPDPDPDPDPPTPPTPPTPPSPPTPPVVTDTTDPAPVVPVTDNDSPIEDHSAGAGIEGEGIMIDG